MKKPNLFIVGAPKCGTTSLANWLAQHPEVFLVDPKEPHYFSFDLTGGQGLTRKDYQKLYRSVMNEKVIIDASTHYLVSKVAIKEALAFSPSAKFIVLLRNPVDLYLSYHHYCCQTMLESELSALRAWETQWDREEHNLKAMRPYEAYALKYAEVCSIGEQVERFYKTVPESQRMTILLDDLKSHREKTWAEVLEFMALESCSIDFRPHNTSFQARSARLQMMIKWLSKKKTQLGIRKTFRIARTLSHLNRRPAPKQAVSDEFANDLRIYFKNDIKKLARVIDRDLSSWLEETERCTGRKTKEKGENRQTA